MYVKQLSENEKIALNQRFEKIKELQEKGTCFSEGNIIELQSWEK